MIAKEIPFTKADFKPFVEYFAVLNECLNDVPLIRLC